MTLPSPTHVQLEETTRLLRTWAESIGSESASMAVLQPPASSAALVRLAADTIDSLRASLTRAEAERDALGEALHRAHVAAADRAMALDREADETSSTIKKMQGATAACIANDILAIANGLSRASGPEGESQ